MKVINYILKRVLQMIPVLLLVMVLIFALIRFIPGDPADVMLGARATEESRAMLHAKMGIDKPIYEQFFLFMKNCLRAVLFCLDFALFAQHSDENCPGIVKKYATARNNRSRLIKVMPL